VRNLYAINCRKCRIIKSPKRRRRMRRNGHSALSVDVGNCFTRVLIGTYWPSNADCNQMVIRVGNLLTGYQNRPVRFVADPLRDQTCSGMVVVGDGEDLKPATAGFATQVDWCQTAIARKGVHVEVAREQPEFSRPHGELQWTPACKRTDYQPYQTDKCGNEAKRIPH
jgi:hypothetical protein